MINVVDLKKQPIFKDLDEREIEKVSKKLTPMSVEKGEYLYRVDDKRRGFYLVHSGRIEVSSTSPDGIEYRLFLRGPGQIAAMLSMSGEEVHQTNAKALEDSVVFLFPIDEFHALETENLLIGFLVYKNFARLLELSLMQTFRSIRNLTLAGVDDSQ